MALVSLDLQRAHEKRMTGLSTDSDAAPKRRWTGEVFACLAVVAVIVAAGCLGVDTVARGAALGSLVLAVIGFAGAWLHERSLNRSKARELGALTDERRLLLEAIEATPTPFALYDAADRLVAWNHSYQQVHDPTFSNLPKPIRYEDLMRSVARQLLPPDQVDAAVVQRVAAHRAADGLPVDRQYPGGRWLRVCKKITPSGGVAGFAADVTELKLREAELLASEIRLRDYAETASDWFWETGHDHCMTVVSSRLEELGFAAAAWLGCTFAEIADDAEADCATWAHHAARMERHEPFREFVFRTTSADGLLRYVSLSGKPIFDPQLDFTGFRGVGRDVSSEKEAERRRRELELQVQHSQRIEALGTLAGGIAHDLNNTMVPVIALSKMMMRRHPKGSLEGANLQMIHDAGTRSRDLVKQILAFSRKEQPTKRELDLEALVRETLPMLRAALPTTIEITNRAAADLPPILGDPSQLHQVLINLVTNAAQAMGNSKGRIAIELSMDAAAPDRGNLALRLQVTDTGCGMDKATTDRMFEPFFTTKEVGEGTGLGLAVVHGIVGGHGGSIEVASELGKGTSIAVLLPPMQPAMVHTSGSMLAALTEAAEIAP
jgi:PAS domain S-box-containing protein